MPINARFCVRVTKTSTKRAVQAYALTYVCMAPIRETAGYWYDHSDKAADELTEAGSHQLDKQMKRVLGDSNQKRHVHYQ